MSAAATYTTAVIQTREHEGGWYDGSQPHDPNPTMYGVIQRTYDAYRKARGLPFRSVRLIEQHELEAIYRGYWTGASLDVVQALAPLTAITLFDHSINAGQSTAVMMLQIAIGATADGGFGSQTKAALEAAVRRYGDVGLADRVTWERQRYYADLAKSAKHRPSLLSWTVRVLKFRERFLRDAP